MRLDWAWFRCENKIKSSNYINFINKNDDNENESENINDFLDWDKIWRSIIDC